MRKTILKYKDKIVFEKVEMIPSFNRIPKVFQENEACFMFINEGAFLFRSPTNLIAIKAGEAVVAKCGNYFIEPYPNQADIGETIVVFGAYFYPDMVKDFFQTDLKLGDFKNNFDVSRAKVEPLMRLFIESIHHLFENPELADDNFIVSKLKELLLILGKTESSIHHFVNALFTPYEYDFREIIQQNTFSNLSLSELARLSGCSLATFKRRFKKFYDLPPAKYLLQKKLEKAHQLLSLDSYTITEIAFECGFDNINHFNKAFKKHYGISPSNSRLSQKEQHLNF